MNLNALVVAGGETLLIETDSGAVVLEPCSHRQQLVDERAG